MRNKSKVHHVNVNTYTNSINFNHEHYDDEHEIQLIMMA